MSAEVTDLGGGSVGTFMPTTIAALGTASAALALPAADIQAQIVGAAEASVSITVEPPSVDLTAALELSASVPAVTVDVTAMTALGAELGISLAALQAAISLLAQLQAGFGSASVRAYRIEGQVGSMGGALSSVTASGLPGGTATDEGLAVVLVAAADPAAVAALRALFV